MKWIEKQKLYKQGSSSWEIDVKEIIQHIFQLRIIEISHEAFSEKTNTVEIVNFTYFQNVMRHDNSSLLVLSEYSSYCIECGMVPR